MFETMQKIAIALMVGAAAVGGGRDGCPDDTSVDTQYFTHAPVGGGSGAR